MLLLLLLALGLAEGVVASTLPDYFTATTRMLLALCLAWPVVLLAVNGLHRQPVRVVFQLQAVAPAVVGLAGLAAVALSVTVLGLVTWIPGPPPESATQFHETVAASNRLALLLAVLLVGPVFEELFFRGWMLPIWVLRFGPVTGIVVTSMFFSLLHIAGWKMLIAFPIGLLLGWIALRGRSVWPAIAGHVAANSGPFALEGALRLAGYTADEVEALDRVPLAIPSFALAAGVVAVALLARATRPGAARVAGTEP
jgi:membrane protease YdiL (CAAX protease family)